MAFTGIRHSLARVMTPRVKLVMRGPTHVQLVTTSIYLFLTVLPVVAATASGGFHLGASIQNQSPDGMIVQVNGAIYHDTGHVVGWWYDWGDGTVSTGYFPTVHRYTQPGTYQVKITGHSDQGEVEQVVVNHLVHSRPGRGTIQSVRLSHRHVGLSPDERLEIDIAAYDHSGQPTSFSDQAGYVSNSNPNAVHAEIETGKLIIRPTLPNDRGSAIAIVCVYVNNVESNDPLCVVVNNNEADYELISTNYTVSYLPKSFFSGICLGDYAKILDLAYLLENESIHVPEGELGIFCQAISYLPQAYGANGNPLSIGDSAFPTNGTPPYGVLFHEMGHNFSGILTAFNCFGVPGAFYQETIAEWEKQYVFKQLLSRYAQELGPEASQMIEALAQDSADYHLREYQAYIQRGMAFDYMNTVGGSHPLVQKIYAYSEEHGWERIKDFMECFKYYHIASLAQLIAAHGGIEPIENRVTVMAGALQIAFPEEAVATDFSALNFPLQEDLFADFILAFDTSSTVR